MTSNDTKILYTGANEGPALMTLGQLIANFDMSGGWYPSRHRDAIIADMRNDLAGLGWYENLHDDGRYLVLNLDKLQLCPTPEGWDDLYKPKPKPVYWEKMSVEFPDFDQSTLPAIPADWQDSSWHNDACPSFIPANGEAPFVVYINYTEAQAAHREMAGPRYSVLSTADATLDHNVLTTDDWEAVLTYVAEATCEGHRDNGRGVCAHCGKAL